MSEDLQIEQVIRTLKDQLRVYGDLIRQGDRLGVVVALKADRERMFQMLEADPALQGKSKIIRARNGDEDDDYDPSFDAATPITILTAAGCKGLEFRAVHWVFAEKNKYHFNNEHYYTVVTRAKTSLHVYYTELLPQALARACPQTVLEW